MSKASQVWLRFGVGHCFLCRQRGLTMAKAAVTYSNLVFVFLGSQ